MKTLDNLKVHASVAGYVSEELFQFVKPKEKFSEVEKKFDKFRLTGTPILW